MCWLDHRRQLNLLVVEIIAFVQCLFAALDIDSWVEFLFQRHVYYLRISSFRGPLRRLELKILLLVSGRVHLKRKVNDSAITLATERLQCLIPAIDRVG